jgi:hypothetical protein
VVEGLLGTEITHEPLFGTLSASCIGKVAPLFVERKISTAWQLIGEAVVFATFQVMV